MMRFGHNHQNNKIYCKKTTEKITKKTRQHDTKIKKKGRNHSRIHQNKKKYKHF